MPTAALIVALVALALLLANWVGYPLVVAAIARRRRAEPPAGTAGAGGADTHPAASVTVVIATRDQPDVLVRRVGRKNTRPLLIGKDPREVLQELMDKRYPVYAEADITVMTDDRPANDAVDAILAALRRRLAPAVG